MPSEENEQLAIRVGSIFTPSAPIDKKALFIGRSKQLRQVVDAINQRGQHAIIFGERGVGKTSLANVLAENLSVPGGYLLMPHVNCDTGDDFSTLWTKVLNEITIYHRKRQAGFDLQETLLKGAPSQEMTEPTSTGDIRKVLAPLASNFLVVIILDEFDRLPGGPVRAMMADTIKMLSDRAIGVTLVLIGVADSVEDLIMEHQSIERNLIQVPMPRMSAEELAAIVMKGLGELQMTIESAALARITQVSRGLPYYTHLLARLAARHAIDSGNLRITALDVATAMVQAVDEVQRSTGRTYHKATSSPRKDALYRQVLLACALAVTDDLGFFAPADVRQPLNGFAKSKKRPYDIANYITHLNDFCESARGPVLKREGSSHRFRYRFTDPMMQPFVVLKGFTDGWLGDEAQVEETPT
jgi:Cdc6-like AAA superfamily ATPase